jgi:signal transduction histidine kinase
MMSNVFGSAVLRANGRAQTRAYELGLSGSGPGSVQVAPGRRAESPWLLGLAVFLIATTIVATILPVHLSSSGLRAAIETMVMVASLLTAVLLLARFRQTRQLRDLMLFFVVVSVALADFPSSVLPALIGADAVNPGDAAHVVSHVLVAAALAATAWAPARLVVHRISRPKLFSGMLAVTLVASLALLDHPGGPHRALAATSGHPLAFALETACVLVLAATAIRFLRSGAYPEPEATLLAGTTLLLGAARLQYVAMPAVSSDWVTPALMFRALAYGALLVVAWCQYRRARRDAAEAALVAERERIARDLHDSLAQDLAFIAAHSDRLASEAGVEHPLTIAARRALAVSRTTIIDLAASTAPSTAAALQQVAGEMRGRFDVRIDVLVAADAARDVDPESRQELVRIAREGISNAIRHGGARHVTVELGSKAHGVLLRITDDGCGIGSAAAEAGGGTGLGLPTMRARAALLGGRLIARGRPAGGTELDVLVS